MVRNLDILGTAVKTLDFSATAWGPFFELCLLNCEKLCAILWPPRLHLPDDKFKLLIDTTQSVSSARYREDGGQVGSIAATQTAVAAPHEHGNRRTTEFGWHISVRDARLLFSLESVYGSSRVAYVEVSSPARPTVTAGFIKDEAIMCGKNNEHQVATHLQRQPGPAVYADTSVARLHQQAKEDQGDAPVIMSMWPCPDPPSLPENSVAKKKVFQKIDATCTYKTGIGQKYQQVVKKLVISWFQSFYRLVPRSCMCMIACLSLLYHQL